MMKKMTFAARAVCCASLLLAAANASAIDRGAVPGGGQYVVGGVGLDESAQISAERGNYSLRVLTAAKKSGAYLADVKLRITTAGGQVVFDQVLTGPWLLVDLGPGKYVVEAALGAEVQRRAAAIGKADHREVIFYFDVPGEDSLVPLERARP